MKSTKGRKRFQRDGYRYEGRGKSPPSVAFNFFNLLSMQVHMLRVLHRRPSSFYRHTRCLSTNAATRDYTCFENLTVQDGVGVVKLNSSDRMNTVSKVFQTEAQDIFLNKIAKDPNVKSVVILSCKEDNFIAGADINMLKAVENKADLRDMCMKGYAFFEEFKASKKPLVAAINGACLGAGLEWAMYCDYRIATTSPKTALGLPEVQLGLLPGMAGTYHLPKLVGYPEALDMILTGKKLKGDKAKKMGLVHQVVDPAALETVAMDTARAFATGKMKVPKPPMNFMSLAIDYIPFIRDYVFKKAKESVDKKTGGHYPAPYAILDVIKGNAGKNRIQHLPEEAAKFAELAATPVSEALIGLFLNSTAVKKHTFGKPKHEIKNVAVLGAGLMGGGIAQVSVDNGKYRVFLKDRDLAAVSKGEKVINNALKDKLAKKKITNYDYATTMSRLLPLYDAHEAWTKHFAKADIVIEAVFEEIGVKHKVLQEMEAVTPDHCIFASNTSAIPIASIAEGAKRPERVIGMHYFSPVPMMPLLEIIMHAGTAPEVAAAAMAVGSRQGKTPILVKDVPGFFVNRALSPMMSEVTALVQEGVELELLDKVLPSSALPFTFFDVNYCLMVGNEELRNACGTHYSFG